LDPHELVNKYFLQLQPEPFDLLRLQSTESTDIGKLVVPSLLDLQIIAFVAFVMPRNARPSLQDHASCMLHDPGHPLTYSSQNIPTTTTHNSAHCIRVAASHKYFLPHPSEPGRFVTATMAVPNFSRVMSDSGIESPTTPASPTGQHLRSSPAKAFGVKRWNGETRAISDWDGLRRVSDTDFITFWFHRLTLLFQDTELWQHDGDCLVHLSGRGKSRRGPAFRIPSPIVRETQCDRLFSGSYIRRSLHSSDVTSDSGYSSASSSEAPCDMFIPAPDDSIREDAFHWHITTRNLFAWIMNKPIVGASLGKAFIDLQERMLLLRPATANNVMDCLAYAENMGYLEFAHTPDYALAFLHFAEQFQLRDLWVDAFCHCVGMNDSLTLSSEFDNISNVTKALIARASLEMDLHLGRVSRALGNILEDELSGTFLGLSAPERAHMDRFRSHLHSYYVAKHGYWPPPADAAFDKDLLINMCNEFHDLYDYLVDTESTYELADQKASGGLCVLQNVNAFNNRHNYEPLEHPLPLMPDCQHLERSVQSQRALRPLRLSTKSTRNVALLSARAALFTATNNVGADVESCPLIQSYIDFEHESISRPEEKLTMSEARKVRWIMIYCTLQMLVSVTKSADEVRDSWSPSYHMCCLVSESPNMFPTANNSALSIHPALRSCEVIEDSASGSTSTTSIQEEEEHQELCESPMSIHPDCERTDYFSNAHTYQRSESYSSLNMLNIAPLRVADSSLSRNASFKSLSRRMSTFSRRNSVRRSATMPARVAATSSNLDESQLATNNDVTDSSHLSIQNDRSGSRTPTMERFDFDTQIDIMSSPGLPGIEDKQSPRTPSPAPLKLHIPTSSPSKARWSINSDSASSTNSATTSHSGSESESGRSTDAYSETPLTPITSYAVSTASPCSYEGKKVAFSFDTFEPKVFAGEDDEAECVRELKGIMGRMSMVRSSSAV